MTTTTTKKKASKPSKASFASGQAALKLFYVRADDDSGENADVFVRAVTTAEAKTAWRGWFRGVFGYAPKASFINYIGEVPEPLTGTRGAIPWDDIHHS